MRIRLTIITENNQPVEGLGNNPEKKIKDAWNAVLRLMGLVGENDDSAYVENVEIVREEGEKDE